MSNNSGRWSFTLADANGASLTELTTAPGKTITYTRNSFSECQLTLSHDDEAAELLWDALENTGMPTLRAYRRGPFDTVSTLRFNGQMAPFSEDADTETSTLQAIFRSPFARLLGDGSERGRYTADAYTITPNGLTTDAGDIAADLLAVANTEGATGLILGTVEASAQRTREYAYSNIGESIQELTSVLDGFDFDEEFVELGSTLAKLNIHARLGQNQTAARFEYGPGTLSNVRGVSRTTQAPINKVTLLGGNGLFSTQTDPASIVKYGVYSAVYSATDVTSQSMLDAKAHALLRPNLVKTVSFTPEVGLENCPRAFEDYNVGDTVHFFARKGALVEQVAARLNGMTVAISDDGEETVEVPDPTTPEEDSFLRASLAIESVDTGESWQDDLPS